MVMRRDGWLNAVSTVDASWAALRLGLVDEEGPAMMKKGSCDSAVVTSSDKSDLLYNHIPHPTRMANGHMSAWIAFAARRCCSLGFWLAEQPPRAFFFTMHVK